MNSRRLLWGIAVIMAIIALAMLGQRVSPPSSTPTAGKSDRKCDVDAPKELKAVAQHWCDNGLVSKVARHGRREKRDHRDPLLTERRANVSAPEHQHRQYFSHADGTNGRSVARPRYLGGSAGSERSARRRVRASHHRQVGDLRGERLDSLPIRIANGIVIQSVEQHEKGIHQEPQPDAPGPRVKNYITPSGLQRLKDEHRFLLIEGASGRDAGGRLGGGQRRSQRERRLSVRQAAAARDRSADSFSHETNRCRGSGGPGSAERRRKRRRGCFLARPCATPMPRAPSGW